MCFKTSVLLIYSSYTLRVLTGTSVAFILHILPVYSSYTLVYSPYTLHVLPVYSPVHLPRGVLLAEHVVAHDGEYTRAVRARRAP